MLFVALVPGRRFTLKPRRVLAMRAPSASRQLTVASMSLEVALQLMSVVPGQSAAMMSSLWAIDFEAMAAMVP